MLTLHLEAATHEDLTRQAIKVLGIVSLEPIGHGVPTPAPVQPEPNTVTATPPATGSVVLPEPAPRATRKRREPAPIATPISSAAASPSPAAAPQPAPSTTADNASALPGAKTDAGVSSSAVPTVDHVRAALGEVNSLFGMAVCTALLESFGAERVSLVPEAKRAEFIKACNDKVAKQKAALAASQQAKA